MMNRTFNRVLAATLTGLFIVVLGVSAQADQITLEVLRQKYERLYQEYTTNLGQATQASRAKLAQEMADAKRAYEDAKRGISVPTKKAVELIKEKTDKALATLDKIAGTGSDRSTVATAGSQVSLTKFAQPDSLNGDNYCGQFAMATVLRGLGLRIPAQDIYDQTNPRGIFTAPPTIVEFLNTKGIPATEKHNAGIGDLRAKLDAGQPAIVLVNSNGTPHWVAVIGYRTDASGAITQIEIRDSVWGSGQSSYLMDIARFQDIWSHPCGTDWKGGMVGYKNLMIEIPAVKDPIKRMPWYGGNFHTATEDTISGACNDVVTGWATKSPTRLVGGLAKGVFGIPGAVFSLGGQALKSGSAKLGEWGSTTWQQEGLTNKLTGGLAIVGGKLGELTGSIARVGGNLLSSGATILGNGIKRLGWVFAKN